MDPVALEADRWLGGHHNSCLLIDESGFRKSGKHSVGVARQWCGRWGKVDSCQVGVFAALGRGPRAAWVDERLYLPQAWVEDPARCRRAGIPKAARVFKTKVQLALEMVGINRSRACDLLGSVAVGFMARIRPSYAAWMPWVRCLWPMCIVISASTGTIRSRP